MAKAVRNPLAILSKEDCKVQSLTISDQHATLLLTHTDDNNSPDDGDAPTKTTQSLLKLTIVPFHKQLLGSNPVLSQEDIDKGQAAERNYLTHHDSSASNKIRSFLKQYKFQLSSDSGEEYSYYIANPEHDKNKPKGSAAGSFDVELISPATPNQISRAMPSLGHVLIEETPQMYLECTKPYIQTVVDSGSLSWVKNLVDVKKEKERLLVNHKNFIINIDTKWRSHPPPLTTPREEWMNHPSTVDLYCLGICKQSDITCLRDLRREHIPLLEAMKKEGLAAIKSIYGVDEDQIRVFIHYQPQFVSLTLLYRQLYLSIDYSSLFSPNPAHLTRLQTIVSFPYSFYKVGE
jgi:hypothetical protein